MYKGLEILDRIPVPFETAINNELVIGYKKEFVDGDYQILIVKTSIKNVYHTKRYAIKYEN